jgi:hypothetical protein
MRMASFAPKRYFFHRGDGTAGMGKELSEDAVALRYEEAAS